LLPSLLVCSHTLSVVESEHSHQVLVFYNYSLFGWLVADGWCWFVLREEYCWLVAAGCWWLVRLLAGG
jgi:hypothetical protein